jgi:hypothetical protein
VDIDTTAKMLEKLAMAVKQSAVGLLAK